MTQKFVSVRLALACALATLCGCSSISMKMPANRFDSPEARGGLFNFNVDPLILESGSELTVVRDYTQTPPQVNSPEFNTASFDYSIGAGMGLLDRLDVTVKMPSYDSPTMFGLKYQVLGNTQANSSTGNFSAAITAAGGYASESGDATGFFGTTTSSYTMKDWAWDASLVFGLRVLGPLLIYTGPFYSQYTLTGTITQPEGSTITYPFGGVARQYGYSLGYELTVGPLVIKFDLAWAHALFASKDQTAFYPGFLLGFRF